MDEAKKTSGIDGVRAKKIGLYLKELSNKYLTDFKNNPIEAIQALIELFENEISSINTIYDILAIKFYILDELIQCNVFPNPKK